jgi:flavin-dependent dehydrogenase
VSVAAHIYDVAIVGAGPTGAATAGQLARLGFDTVVLESVRPSRLRAGEFLSPQARALTHRLSLLQPDWEAPHRIAHAFHTVWGESAPVTRHYLFDPRGHALLLDRAHFEFQLLAAARGHGLTIVPSGRVAHATRRGGLWTLTTRTGQSMGALRAGFLIDCSGRIGAPAIGVSSARTRIDRMICLGVRLEGYHGDATPAVESYSRGWAYSAGIGRAQLIINLCTEPSPHRGGLAGYFLGELAQCPIAASRVGRAVLRAASDVCLFSTDCASTVTRPATGTGWCLAGDRAQSMDPLCGGGMESAFEHARLIADAARAARTLREIDLATYAASLDAGWSRYLMERQVHYNREKRRPHPFWQRRASGGRLEPASGVAR